MKGDISGSAALIVFFLFFLTVLCESDSVTGVNF